jgi:ABC-type glycerol-3-phosphate transport system substrate-binding protein
MSRIKKQYPPFWLNEGTVNGKLYAVYLKADVKSLVWYAPGKFRAGHYSIPKTWSQLIQLSEKMIKAGKHPWAFGAQDGWTLTDFLENIYLSQNGPALYRKWYLHQIRWTDPTIRSAFSLLNQIVAKDSMIAGGRTRVLSQPWDEGAKQMVTDPQAEFFQEASFVVAGLRSELPKVREGADYSAFPFPMVRSWPATPVEVGPSGMVMLHNTPGARALMTCLTDPTALAQWARRGDYISPNDALPSSDYPDPILRAAAALLARAGKADLVVGDASDEMPAALGSDYEYTELQRYFKDPSSLNMVLNRLEAKARQVYGH